jgi:hypothetical protein
MWKKEGIGWVEIVASADSALPCGWLIEKFSRPGLQPALL